MCIWLPTNTPPKYCCLWMLRDWRALSNRLTKGPANSLSVTLVLLIIFSFCLRAFNQCLFNPYHLLYRLSDVCHLLDNNLSLTYAMNHQCPTWQLQAPVVGSQSLGIWDTTAAPGLLDDWNCAHPVKIPFGWEGQLHECQQQFCVDLSLLVDHLTFVVGSFGKKRPV